MTDPWSAPEKKPKEQQPNKPANDSKDSGQKKENSNEEKPKLGKREWFNAFLWAGSIALIFNYFSGKDDISAQPVDHLQPTEFIQLTQTGKIQAAEIQKIDGKHVVTGTYTPQNKPEEEKGWMAQSYDTIFGADEDSAAEPTIDQLLAEGPKYKTIINPVMNTADSLKLRDIPYKESSFNIDQQYPPEIISVSDFEDLLDKKMVKAVGYQDDADIVNYTGIYSPGGKYGDAEFIFQTSEHGKNVVDLTKKIRESGAERMAYKAEGPGWLGSWGIYLLFPIIFIGAIWYQTRQQSKQMGNLSKFGSGGHQVIMPEDEKMNIKFEDVQGIDHAVDDIQEMVTYLKDPEGLKAMGAKPPKGAMLMGPPGTGKTMLAKAVAAEAGVPFISIKGSDFVEMLVGVGAQRTRALFDDARKNAPCVIFIDEIDAIGGNRGQLMTNGGSEQQQTLTQILTEMDGFDEASGMMVIAATNRPESLDPALMRAGRFDRKIEVNVADFAGRIKILDVHMQGKAIADDVDSEILANITSSWSGAELANLVNEALLRAKRQGRDKANMEDFREARDKIKMGAKKNLDITDEDRRLTCDHEAGHALVMKFTEGSNKILKATAVPRANTLGLVETYANGDTTSYNKQQLLAMMDAFMAGRIAEEICHGEDKVTTGASNDIKMATYIAREMILKWGWSSFGMQTFIEEQQQANFLSKGSSALMDLDDETKRQLNREISQMIEESYERARALMILHSEEHKAISDALFTHETVTGEEIDMLCRGEKITRKPNEPANDNKKNNLSGRNNKPDIPKDPEFKMA